MNLENLSRSAARSCVAVTVGALLTLGVAGTAAATPTGSDQASTYADVTQPGGVPTITFDSDGDGVHDTTALDQDANGAFEVMLHDSDGDGDTELWMYDDNQNVVFERFVVDTDNDGEMDVFVTDSDADEVPDAVLVDANLNSMDDREEAALQGTGAIVGPPTDLDPLNKLMLVLAAQTGHVEYGTPDSDHDGYADNQDAHPGDPYRR